MPEETEVLAPPDAASEVEEQAKPAAVPEAASTEGEQEEQGAQRGIQRRFDKLTREKYELREQLAELRGRLASQPAPTAAKSEPDDPRPDVKTWQGTYEELTAAIARWEARQEYRAERAKEREATAKAEREEREQEVVTTYRERVREFTAEHDDFDAVVNRILLPQTISAQVADAIREDDHGPDLAYYLGQHPEFREQLSGMSAAGAVKALGRLSERLFPETADEEEDENEEAVATPAKPKAAVQAPAPIKPVRKPSPASTGLSDDLPIDEWVKRREAQLKRK
jgi:hypothetical protein